jgi:hypothetical protein
MDSIVKKLRSAKAPVGRASRPAPVLPVAPSNLGGKLPGDDANELYWEARVARWLGVALKRVRGLRRRALREGEHWLVIEREVVYSLSGVQAMRDHLRSLGVTTADGKAPAKEEPAREPVAPAGPPTRAQARVLRLYPNKRLLQCELIQGRARVEVLAMVRDNTNFMPGMALELTNSPATNNWQYCGRMPRRRGKW